MFFHTMCMRMHGILDGINQIGDVWYMKDYVGVGLTGLSNNLLW